MPAAGLSALVARSTSNPMRGSFSSLVFHRPLVVHSGDMNLQLCFSADGSVTISEDCDSEETPICSGKTSTRTTSTSFDWETSGQTSSPWLILDQEAVYGRLGYVDVHFGPAFRNIRKVEFWDSHADALIECEDTEYPFGNLIRQLDACLHLFGAVNFTLGDRARRDGGSFLPQALAGFTIHATSASLPQQFICRYKLPLSLERGRDLISTAFNVYSLRGDVLVSREKYTVAWIPSNIIIQSPVAAPHDQGKPGGTVMTLGYNWISHSLPPITTQQTVASRALIFSLGRAGDGISLCHTVFPGGMVLLRTGNATQSDRWIDSKKAETFTDMELDALIRRDAVVVVLDATHLRKHVSYAEGMAVWQDCLSLLKVLIGVRDKLKAVVALSGGIEGPTPQLSTSAWFSLGSVVQGMLRVFRTELGLSPETVWGVNLESTTSLVELSPRLRAEVHTRLSGEFSSSHGLDSLVLLRHGGGRFVPRLVPLHPDVTASGPHSSTGIAVIAGMGTIGRALAQGMLQCKAASGIIFLGRREATAPAVSNAWTPLQLCR